MQSSTESLTLLSSSLLSSTESSSLSSSTESSSLPKGILYVGIDYHLRTWAVSIYSEHLFLRRVTLAADCEALHGFLVSHYNGYHCKLAYESGFCGYWACRKLRALGLDCQVIHAADIPSSNKDKRRKTDNRDSKRIGLALQDKHRSLSFNYIGSEEAEKDRALPRYIDQLTRDIGRWVARCRSACNLHGIGLMTDKAMSNKLVTALRAYCVDKPFPALLNTLDTYDLLRKQKLATIRQLRELSKTERFASWVTLLMSVHGFGLLHSMKLQTEIMDWTRFKTFDKLASYCGLASDMSNSGVTEKNLGLTPRCNHQIRLVLIEASWVIIRHDNVMMSYYEAQLASGKKPNLAIVKVARKLLSRLHHMMKNGVCYEIGITKTLTPQRCETIVVPQQAQAGEREPKAVRSTERSEPR